MRERSRSARPARRTSLFGNPALRRESQKSPFRRCFKPRPPWRAGCAGSPPAADRMSKESGHFLRRLSGLLSGCPPIDTRPQARAKLGRDQIGELAARRKRFDLFDHRCVLLRARCCGLLHENANARGRFCVLRRHPEVRASVCERASKDGGAGDCHPSRLGAQRGAPSASDRMSLSFERRLTLDAVTRVARIGRVEPQARKVSHERS